MNKKPIIVKKNTKHKCEEVGRQQQKMNRKKTSRPLSTFSAMFSSCHYLQLFFKTNMLTLKRSRWQYIDFPLEQ